MSFIYNSAKEAFLGGTNSIDLLSGNIGVALVSTSYQPGSAGTAAGTHSILNHVSTSNIVKTAFLNSVSTATQSSGITITSGVFDGPDITISSVPGSAVSINALVFFEHLGANYNTSTAAWTNAKLICYVDQASSGLPVVNPGGANVTVVFDNGANKIFSL